MKTLWFSDQISKGMFFFLFIFNILAFQEKLR